MGDVYLGVVKKVDAGYVIDCPAVLAWYCVDAVLRDAQKPDNVTVGSQVNFGITEDWDGQPLATWVELVEQPARAPAKRKAPVPARAPAVAEEGPARPAEGEELYVGKVWKQSTKDPGVYFVACPVVTDWYAGLEARVTADALFCAGAGVGDSITFSLAADESPPRVAWAELYVEASHKKQRSETAAPKSALATSAAKAKAKALPAAAAPAKATSSASAPAKATVSTSAPARATAPAAAAAPSRAAPCPAPPRAAADRGAVSAAEKASPTAEPSVAEQLAAAKEQLAAAKQAKAEAELEAVKVKSAAERAELERLRRETAEAAAAAKRSDEPAAADAAPQQRAPRDWAGAPAKKGGKNMSKGHHSSTKGVGKDRRSGASWGAGKAEGKAGGTTRTAELRFATSEENEAALALYDSELAGYPPGHLVKLELGSDGMKVTVSNLPANVRETDLKAHFQECGRIVFAKVHALGGKA